MSKCDTEKYGQTITDLVNEVLGDGGEDDICPTCFGALLLEYGTHLFATSVSVVSPEELKNSNATAHLIVDREFKIVVDDMWKETVH